LEATSSTGAAETAQTALRLTRRDRYPVLLPWVHWVLGRATAEANPARAIQFLRRAATEAEALGMRPLLANVLWSLGNLSGSHQKDNTAPIFSRAQKIRQELGMRFWNCGST
jgi:hypothetical protein